MNMIFASFMAVDYDINILLSPPRGTSARSVSTSIPILSTRQARSRRLSIRDRTGDGFQYTPYLLISQGQLIYSDRSSSDTGGRFYRYKSKPGIRTVGITPYIHRIQTRAKMELQ